MTRQIFPSLILLFYYFHPIAMQWSEMEARVESLSLSICIGEYWEPFFCIFNKKKPNNMKFDEMTSYHIKSFDKYPIIWSQVAVSLFNGSKRVEWVHQTKALLLFIFSTILYNFLYNSLQLRLRGSNESSSPFHFLYEFTSECREPPSSN